MSHTTGHARGHTYTHLSDGDRRRYVLERARELEWAHWQTSVRLREASADPAADADVVEAARRDLQSLQARRDVLADLLADLPEHQHEQREDGGQP